MRKPEQRLWDRMRTNVSNSVRLERIENLTGSGTPDVLAIWCGKVTWIENKVGHWPKRMGTRIQFKHPPTVEQCNWHLNWFQNGGTSYVLIGIEGFIFLVPGHLVDGVSSMTRNSIHKFIADWAAINKALMRKK